jgi:hypothetical protein
VEAELQGWSAQAGAWVPGQLEEELAQLTTKEKAAVARSLIDALDEKWDEDVERLWMEEAESRYAAYRRREAKTTLAPDVFYRVWEGLRK